VIDLLNRSGSTLKSQCSRIFLNKTHLNEIYLNYYYTITTMELNRRSLLRMSSVLGAATIAGCTSDGKSAKQSENNQESTYVSEEELRENLPSGANPNMSAVEFAEGSAELELTEFNEDMAARGYHLDTNSEYDGSIEGDVIDTESVSFRVKEVESNTPAPRYELKASVETSDDGVFRDFSDYEDTEMVVDQMTAGMASMMYPAAGNLVTDNFGVNYNSSERKENQPAVAGISFEVRDKEGNSLSADYGESDLGELGEIFEDNQFLTTPWKDYMIVQGSKQ